MANNSTGDGFPDVVVTAVASSTALAPDAEDTWQQLLEGQSGIRRLDKPFVDEFDLPVRIGGELREDFDQHLNRVELRRLSYMQKMSRVLGRRLWESAGTPDVDTRRLLVSIGIALGTTEAMIFLYDDFQNAECGRPIRWPCRCTCRTRRPPRSGWIEGPRPVSPRR